jgi:hypothetical protein
VKEEYIHQKIALPLGYLLATCTNWENLCEEAKLDPDIKDYQDHQVLLEIEIRILNNHGVLGGPRTKPRRGWREPEHQAFTIHRRNYGHWDVATSDKGRIFRIRGGPGKYVIVDERSLPETSNTSWPPFKTLSTLMAALTDELMFEHLSVEGREPHEIESWDA